MAGGKRGGGKRNFDANVKVRALVNELNWKPICDKEDISQADLQDYLRFIVLKAAARDHDASTLSPPPHVDKVWHKHLLYMKHYRTMCDTFPQGKPRSQPIWRERRNSSRGVSSNDATNVQEPLPRRSARIVEGRGWDELINARSRYCVRFEESQDWARSSRRRQASYTRRNIDRRNDRNVGETDDYSLGHHASYRKFKRHSNMRANTHLRRTTPKE